MTRRPPRTPAERTNIDRADIFLEAQVQSDPVKALRDRLTKMLVMEQRINDELYASDPIDHSGLTASNRRLIELGQALKALPSQAAGENKGGQRSTAEIIADQLAKGADPTTTKEAEELHESMASRAAVAFGEGA